MGNLQSVNGVIASVEPDIVAIVETKLNTDRNIALDG